MPKIHYDVDDAYNRIAYAREKEQLNQAYSEWVKSSADLDNTYNEKVKAYQGKSYIDGKDISDFSNNYGVQKNILADQGRNLRAQIQKYQKYIGQEQANKILSGIEKTANSQQQIFDGLKQASDYFQWEDTERKYLDAVKTKQSPDLHDYRDLTEYALQNPIGLTADQVVSSAVQNGWFDALSTSLGENIVHKEKVNDGWKNELKTAVAKARYLNALADKNGGELPENFSIESLSGKTADDFSNMMKLQGLNPDTKMSFDDMVLARYEQKRKAAEYGMDDFGKSSAAVISAVPAGVENFGKGIVSAIEGTVNQVGGNGDKVLTEEEIKRRQARDAALYPALSAYSRIYKPNVADVPLGNALSDLTFAGANMVPSIAMNAVLPGSGLWATGISSGGNSYDQALSEGKTQNQAFGYGLVSGVLESTTQKLLGGIQGLGSSAISKLGSKLPSNILGKVGAAFKKAANTKIGSYFLDNLSEGSEEWLQANLDPIVRNVLLDENNEIKPFSEDKLYAGLLGFFNAAVLNAPGLFTGRNSTVTDQNIPDPLIQDMLDNRAAIAEAMQQGIVQDTNAEKLGETGQIPAIGEAAAENSTTSQAKYSIRTDASGNQYVNVDTDQNIFEGLQPSEINKMAKMYIKEYLLGSTPLGDTDTSVIDSKSASKYTNPGKRQAHFNEKMKTSPELKNLLSIATKVSESDAVKTNSTYPKYEYYSADFEIDGQRFNGLINIGVDENGVKHFYDINKIHLINGISQDANRGIDKMYSDTTIPQDTSGVNTSISENGENDTAQPIRIAQSELDQMKTVSEKLGVKLRIADPGEQYDGSYQNGVITISPRTSQPALVVYKHELTHYIAENTDYYGKLHDLVKEYYQQENANYPQMVRDRMEAHRLAGEKIDYPGAEQEIVADFVGEHLFTDEAAIQQLVEQEPNLGMRIKNWIRSILAYFKKDQQPALLLKAERLYQKAIDQVLKQRQEGARVKQGGVKHSINPDFEAQYDRWDKKDSVGYFKVGTTSEALESIGINPSEIYWDKAKIIKIQKAHPDMTDEVIKQVPQLLENPMLIMQSQTAVNRIVVLGEVYADGKPVLCALELKPNGNIDNFIKIASAYPKNPLQNLVNTSDILYVNPDKNRTDSWLKAIRLQLPSRLTNYGSIHNVTYVDKNVKGNVTFGEAPAKTAMQAAFEKAGYNTSISKTEQNSTSEPKHSLNKRYAEMVEQYGKIKPGEHPARDVDVPKQTNADTKVRQGVRTIMEAKGTPDAFVEELKADIADGIFNYEVISDKEAVSAAKGRLENLGLQKCAAYWKEKMADQKRMTKFDFALAEQMYIEAGENGDFKLAEELAIDMAMLGTEGGQLVQAQRLLKNLTPYGRLYKVEQIIQKTQQELDSRFGEKAPAIEISEKLKKQLHDAKSIQEMDDIEDAIVRDISKQLPAADFARKWNEWRYLAMLGNPKTHLRNIFGNLLFTPAVMGKNALGVAFEQAIPKEQRTKAFLSLKDKALFDFAMQDFKEMVNFVTGERTDQRGIKAIEKYRRVYKNRVLEGMRKLNSKALEKEDKIFVEGHYISSMAQLIKARGWDVNNLTEQQLFAAREYATREAQKATYRDESKIADALNRFSRTHKAAELIIGGNMPFKKTPVNILKRGVEYSPAGLVKGVKELCWDVRKGKMDASQAIDSICSGLTGTGMMALGIWLSMIGILKSTPDDDKEETLERLSGGQEYAIEIGGKSYTIDWIAPMSMPLFVGAELQKAVENRGQEDAKITSRLIDAVCNISEPMFNLSMLQGLTSSIKAGAYSDQPLIDIAVNTVASYLTQGLPTLGGQLARSTDTKQRNSYYSSKDTALEKLLDKTVKKAMAKVPGVSHLLEPYVDKWGKEESYGNLFLNALENFFSPGYASERTDDKVTEEVAQIYARSGESSVVPRTAPSSVKFDGETYRLQEEEYTAYQKTLGQKSYEMVNQYIRSDHYSDMTDAERALAIQRLYTYANEMAKKEFFTGRNVDYDDMPTVKKFAELEEAGIELSDYLYASIKTKDIQGRKNAKGKTISGSVKQNKIKCMVDELGFSRAEANKLYEFL